MTDCPCGVAVRLRVFKLTVNRKRGVAHYIEHVDGAPACGGPWDCVALKPYCRDESQREYAKLLRRWEAYAAIPPATVGAP